MGKDIKILGLVEELVFNPWKEPEGDFNIDFDRAYKFPGLMTNEDFINISIKFFPTKNPKTISNLLNKIYFKCEKFKIKFSENNEFQLLSDDVEKFEIVNYYGIINKKHIFKLICINILRMNKEFLEENDNAINDFKWNVDYLLNEKPNFIDFKFDSSKRNESIKSYADFYRNLREKDSNTQLGIDMKITEKLFNEIIENLNIFNIENKFFFTKNINDYDFFSDFKNKIMNDEINFDIDKQLVLINGEAINFIKFKTITDFRKLIVNYYTTLLYFKFQEL
jgi:hypothetical protein